jgi:sec-independent protein translocase protein TatC
MVFAAVATPSTDPFSMLMLAIPMVILFLISEIICRILDRVRGRGAHRTDQWADDEISPL